MQYPHASHDEFLRTREKGADGKYRTLWLTHPHGNRKVRRYRQRHHPFFTKSRHKGRDWGILVSGQRQEATGDFAFLYDRADQSQFEKIEKRLRKERENGKAKNL